MRRGLLVLCAALPSSVSAAGLEAAGYLGRVIPFYEQSLRFDPGGLVLPGGAVVPPGEALRLEARGGSALSGGITLYLADFVGLEVRIDTADLDVDSRGARYRVGLNFPGGLPDAVGDLELGTGSMQVERVRPLSLNLKLRTPGRLRLALSGGVSLLPRLRFLSAQGVRLRISELGGRPTDVELASLDLRAEARPGDEDSGRLGANAGLGLQVRLGPRLWLVGEGRAFLFQRHRLYWRRGGSRPLSVLEDTLASEVERRLDPLDFNPVFLNAAAGLALAF